jgi:hypothetical protein
VRGVEPFIACAVNVTKAPDATDVTGLPEEVIAMVVEVDAGGAVELPTDTVRGALDESEPEVPVIVTGADPADAVLLAVSVRMLDPGVIGLAEKVAVTPLGSPVADKVTLPSNAFDGVTITVDFPAPPGTRLIVPGAAASAKPGVLTVRSNVVVSVRPPETPVTVINCVPGVAEALAVSVSVLLVVDELGENDAVTPFGKPEAEKLTLPVNPYWGLTLMLNVPEVPGFNEYVLADTYKEKLGP